ncbi:MAG: hypothetical protein IPM29_26050 [Planctomycetes bacterium]|nr:hypothetical protein [Planctomycetota bacterium]
MSASLERYLPSLCFGLLGPFLSGCGDPDAADSIESPRSGEVERPADLRTRMAPMLQDPLDERTWVPSRLETRSEQIRERICGVLRRHRPTTENERRLVDMVLQHHSLTRDRSEDAASRLRAIETAIPNAAHVGSPGLSLVQALQIAFYFSLWDIDPRARLHTDRFDAQPRAISTESLIKHSRWIRGVGENIALRPADDWTPWRRECRERISCLASLIFMAETDELSRHLTPDAFARCLSECGIPGDRGSTLRAILACSATGEAAKHHTALADTAELRALEGDDSVVDMFVRALHVEPDTSADQLPEFSSLVFWTADDRSGREFLLASLTALRLLDMEIDAAEDDSEAREVLELLECLVCARATLVAREAMQWDLCTALDSGEFARFSRGAVPESRQIGFCLARCFEPELAPFIAESHIRRLRMMFM